MCVWRICHTPPDWFIGFFFPLLFFFSISFPSVISPFRNHNYQKRPFPSMPPSPSYTLHAKPNRKSTDLSSCLINKINNHSKRPFLPTPLHQYKSTQLFSATPSFLFFFSSLSSFQQIFIIQPKILNSFPSPFLSIPIHLKTAVSKCVLCT